jgi:hypothetical protein
MRKYECNACGIRICTAEYQDGSGVPFKCTCIVDRYCKPQWKEIERKVAKMPKLTAEVFDRPDCPAWAKYAAVDENGIAFYYRDIPRKACETWRVDSVLYYQEISGEWDASDWKHSLIERPVKERKLPDWCKLGAVGWHKRAGYFEVCADDELARRISTQQIDDKSRGWLSYETMCTAVKQARLRPYNAEEMKALVGKVIEVEPGQFSLCLRVKGLWADFLDDCGYEDDRARIISYDCDMLKHGNTIDGKLCGVLEHLENGEWVK